MRGRLPGGFRSTESLSSHSAVTCYCQKNNDQPELSTAQICAIIDQVAQAGCLWLGFTGGEILVRDDFREIYGHALAQGLLVSLLTNGTLISREIAEYLGEYKPLQVEITLYGMTEATYEKVTGVKGMIQRVREGIRLLQRYGIPLNLKTTVTRDNARDLDAIKRFARKIGVEHRFDAQIHGRIGGSKEPWEYRLSPEEIVALDLAHEERLTDWRRYVKEFWGPVKYDSYFYCSALRNHFFIDAYGNLVTCVINRSHKAKILESSFCDCWEELYRQVYGVKVREDFACRACELAHLCDHCPGWAQLENSDWNKASEFLCRLAHLRYRAFLKEGIIDPCKGRDVIPA
jgi:radical SAM protein with 4Fe4S-binding SPASM domain